MDINRNNYEEYFLLYADNELSGSEKEVVEAFVMRNIDLKNEFLITQLTVISPDQNIQLDDKSFLLKKTTDFITENNYEEIFMLYHDNELSDQQKEETELFAAQNLQFKKVFEWIGKSKLIPDGSVIYPSKNKLYKKEVRGKILTLNWGKGVAAAIFIGFGIWLFSSYFNQSSTDSRSVSLSKNIIEDAVKEKPVENKIADIHLQAKKEDNTANLAQIDNSKNNEKPVKSQAMKPNLIAIKKSIINTRTNDNQTVKISAVKTRKDNHLQLAVSDKIIEQLPPGITKMKPNLQNVTVVNQPYEMDSEAGENSATQTVYYNTSNEGQDYVFYDISAEEFRRSKVGGFLKKLKRMVERNNPITRLFALSEEQLFSKN